jgi:hypothetical protein
MTGSKQLAAVLMFHEGKGRPREVDHVRVTPVDDRHDHRIKVETLFGSGCTRIAWAIPDRGSGAGPEPNQLLKSLGQQNAG